VHSLARAGGGPAGTAHGDRLTVLPSDSRTW